MGNFPKAQGRPAAGNSALAFPRHSLAGSSKHCLFTPLPAAKTTQVGRDPTPGRTLVWAQVRDFGFPEDHPSGVNGRLEHHSVAAFPMSPRGIFRVTLKENFRKGWHLGHQCGRLDRQLLFGYVVSALICAAERAVLVPHGQASASMIREEWSNDSPSTWLLIRIALLV
jgi:hypothetical protein